MPSPNINSLDFFDNDGSPIGVLAGKISASNFDFFDNDGSAFLSYTPQYDVMANINSVEFYDAQSQVFPFFYGNINANIEVFDAQNQPFILWSPFIRAPAAPEPPIAPIRKRRIFLIS